MYIWEAYCFLTGQLGDENKQDPGEKKSVGPVQIERNFSSMMGQIATAPRASKLQPSSNMKKWAVWLSEESARGIVLTLSQLNGYYMYVQWGVTWGYHKPMGDIYRVLGTAANMCPTALHFVEWSRQYHTTQI